MKTNITTRKKDKKKKLARFVASFVLVAMVLSIIAQGLFILFFM